MLGWRRLLPLTHADNATTNRKSERMRRGLKRKNMSYNCEFSLDKLNEVEAPNKEEETKRVRTVRV